MYERLPKVLDDRGFLTGFDTGEQAHTTHIYTHIRPPQMPAAAARGCAQHHRPLSLFLLLLAACAAAFPQQPTNRLLSSSRRPVTMSSSTKGVLFICLGNICRYVVDAGACLPDRSIRFPRPSHKRVYMLVSRSPSAEAVFKAVVDKNGQCKSEGSSIAVRDQVGVTPRSKPTHILAASAFKIDSCGTGGGNPNWYQKGGWSYHEGYEDAHAGRRVTVLEERQTDPFRMDDVLDVRHRP